MTVIRDGVKVREVTLVERHGLWSRIYELVLNVLGSTGIIIPIGDDNHENLGRTVCTTTGEEASIFTYSEAVTSFDAVPSLKGPSLIPIVGFNGTDEEADTPDAAFWSRGDGSNDSPFSVGVWANVTDMALERNIFAKWDVTSGDQKREWRLSIDSSDKLFLRTYDESVNVGSRRESDAAITMDEFRFLVGTYDGAGGANAADTIALYDNGVVLASTANNNASYVAMEDLAGFPTLGFNLGNSGPDNLFDGSMAGGPLGPFFTHKELTADEVLRLYYLGRAVLDV